MSTTMPSLDVAIIGAGASGLTAAFDLIEGRNDLSNGIKVLEATHRFGGRVKKFPFHFNGTTFPDDFPPVDLGGEWVSGEPSMLQEISRDDLLDVDSLTIEWRPDYHRYRDGVWTSRQSRDSDDNKWVHATWYDFFENNIATPSVLEAIVYGCEVNTIDYSMTEHVQIACTDGRRWTAQHVIVTAPVPILQNGINFTPALPDSYQTAIDSLYMLHGLKVVFQFKDKFYPETFTIEDYDGWNESGRYFYNPYWNQNTNGTNVMTVEILGEFAEQYTSLPDDDIIAIMLEDLDAVFGNNTASNNVMASFVQNWNNNPYTQGVYSGSNSMSILQLRQPLEENRIVFAGEAIPRHSMWQYGYVHGAAFSGRGAADLIPAKAVAPASSQVGISVYENVWP